MDNIEAKDLSVRDVVERTGMPESYLNAIINDHRDALPAFPYVRIYLIRLAEVLSLTPTEVIEQYKAEFNEKVSGAADMLPGNRFALPSSRRRYLIGGGICAVIILGYVLSNSGFFGKPSLALSMPPQNSGDPYIVNEASIQLVGQIQPGDKLLINGQAAPLTAEGSFTIEYPLSPELNTIEFMVSRFLGRQISVVKHVYYQEASTTVPTSVRTSSSTQ